MIPAKPPNGQSSSSDAPGGPNWQRVARMDAEFLRTTVGDRLAKAVAAAAESGADDKVEYIADWLLNQVSVEEAGVAAAEQAAAVGALPRQEGSADDASPGGGRSLSRRPSAADALAAPPPAADPSGAALPRMMADF